MLKSLWFLLILILFPMSVFSQVLAPRTLGAPGINYPNRYQLNPYPVPVAPDGNSAVVGRPYYPYYPYGGYPNYPYDPYYGGIQSDGDSVYVPGN